MPDVSVKELHGPDLLQNIFSQFKTVTRYFLFKNKTNQVPEISWKILPSFNYIELQILNG
jgi:hypothetical protein